MHTDESNIIFSLIRHDPPMHTEENRSNINYVEMFPCMHMCITMMKEQSSHNGKQWLNLTNALSYISINAWYISPLSLTKPSCPSFKFRNVHLLWSLSDISAIILWRWQLWSKAIRRDKHTSKIIPLRLRGVLFIHLKPVLQGFVVLVHGAHMNRKW